MPNDVESLSLVQSDRNYQVNLLATDTRLGVVFGTTQITGRIAIFEKDGEDHWLMAVLWSLGPCTDIADVLLNGEAPAKDTELTHYLGTLDQNVDPTLASKIKDFNDRHIWRDANKAIGFAYTVLRYRNEDYKTPPTVTANITGIVGTENAVLAAEELITNSIYGRGDRVNRESFDYARGIPDSPVLDGENRHKLGLLVDDTKSVDQWIETLATYSSCHYQKLGGEWYAIPRRPLRALRNVGPHRWIAGSHKTKFGRPGTEPNSVMVLYTHTYDDGTVGYEPAIWQHQDVVLGRVESRNQIVVLAGINRYGEALRVAEERGRNLAIPKSYEIRGFIDLLEFVIGSRLSDENGRQYICTETPRINEAGLVQLTYRDYDETVFSDASQDEPQFTHGSPFIGL